MAEDKINVENKEANQVLDDQDKKVQADNIDGVNNGGIDEEFKQKISKLDSVISKMADENRSLKTKLESIETQKRAQELASKTEQEQLEAYKKEAETLRKKEKFRDLCSEKGLDANLYMPTALQMAEDNLENFVNDLHQKIEFSKKSVEEETKKAIIQKAKTIEPSGDSEKKDEEEAYFDNYIKNIGKK